MTQDKVTPFRKNRSLQAMMILYAAFWILLAIAPRDRSNWLLENLLVFVSVAGLVITYRRFPLSNTSYLLITIFLTLHTIGAHYTYEHALPGYWIKDFLKLPRNPFDRIVHFSCGLLLAYPLREMVVRVAKTTRFWMYFFPLMIVMATSGFFEMLESWVARIVSPELGAAYLGTQGDVWDAQKDMTLATIGALLSLGIIWLVQKQNRHKMP